MSSAAWAMYTDRPSFIPIAPNKGSLVAGALRAAVVSGAASRSEPFLFAGLQPDPLPPDTPGPAELGQPGYLLGLSSSGRIVLVKGALVDGIPDVAPGTQGVLARSEQAFRSERAGLRDGGLACGSRSR